MGSRKSVKIAATVLLIVGNLFMLAFLGMLIYCTVLLGPRIFGATSLVLPAYIAFVSYTVGSVLGLIHILTEPRRPRKWILVVIKILVDIVFSLSAVLTVPALFIKFIIALFTIDVDGAEIASGLGILVIVIAAAFYIASFCVWYCFLCVQKLNDQDDQENGDIKNEEIQMNSMGEKPPV